MLGVRTRLSENIWVATSDDILGLAVEACNLS